MPKTIIAEGKTTTEAIANGLKQLNVSKDRVDIKILEEHEKRSFFSILAPRVVKVELTMKEGKGGSSYPASQVRHYKEKEYIPVSKEELLAGKERVETFLKEFLQSFGNLEYKIEIDEANGYLIINLNGENDKILIGYRGEVLNALQNIANAVANRNAERKLRVILNISNYREKREKALEELADKVSKTVLKTGKSITLEPMVAYERKIIHNRLQSSNRVRTYSIGEEPYRKVVIAKK